MKTGFRMPRTLKMTIVLALVLLLIILSTTPSLAGLVWSG
jgi:hypothetical protein